ncbi:uncharacterized protein [Diadema antillarum]|uniref:uncharacterized protein n=1 Tax=Diadema antillarum TaxID=105358 RepID=UPI003A870387
MVLVKNVNPQQPDNQALRDEPANPNPPDIHPPPADRDDPEKIDWIEACLLTTVAMAAVLMFSLIISDCLLGVDLPLFMSSSVEGLGSYSFQVFQSTHLILLDTIAACLSLLQSAWAMLSVSKWPHLFWSTIRNMLTSLKSASVTLWRDYLPIVKNGVIALATSLDRWATQYFGPFFGEFFSYLQSTVNKLLDSDTSTKQPQPGFFDLAVLFVTFLATIPLAYMTITNLVFIIHKI